MKRLARSARHAVLLLLAATVTIVVRPPVAHADLPDCTDADRSHGSGLQIADHQASITFTLARDCVIGLTAYEVRGKDQIKYANAVANTAGTHTLTVPLPPCYQVDFHPGAVHTRGEGRAIRYAKDCEEVPPPVVSPTTTAAPAPPTTTTPTTSTIPTETAVSVLSEVVSPAPSGELAATGSEIADNVAIGLMGIGLGLGTYRAGRWGRRRVFERSQS